MTHCKVLCYIPQTNFMSKSFSVKNHGSVHDYYNQWYRKVNKKCWCINLYKNSMKSHRDRMERIWWEYITCICLILVWSLYLLAMFFKYCEVMNIDLYHMLKKSFTDRINNFFHWICNKYTVKKVSSVTTYWHQFSQIYIKYKRKWISLLILKKVSEIYYSHDKIVEQNWQGQINSL